MAVGLLRLQDTYRLDTKDIASGIVKDTRTKPMTGLFIETTYLKKPSTHLRLGLYM